MKIVRVSRPSYRQRGQKWEVNYSWEDEGGAGGRSFRGGFTKKILAESYYQSVVQQVAAGTFQQASPRFKTMRSLVDEYMASAAAFKGERTRVRDQQILTNFLRHVPPGISPAAITRLHIDQYLAARAGKVAPGTIDREVAVLRRMFAVAVEWEILRRNPTQGIKKRKQADKVVVYLEPEEQAQLLAAASARALAPYLRPMVATAIYTGMRHAELLNLRWRQIDFATRTIRVENTADFRTKTGRSRIIGLSAAAVRELQAWRDWWKAQIAYYSARATRRGLAGKQIKNANSRLDALRATAPEPDRYVFPNFANPDQPMLSVRSCFQAAVEAAFPEGHPRRDTTMHHLRHTFAVMLARAGVPLIQIAALMGHSDLSTTQIYLRFAPDEGVMASTRIPEIAVTPARVVEPIAAEV